MVCGKDAFLSRVRLAKYIKRRKKCGKARLSTAVRYKKREANFPFFLAFFFFVEPVIRSGDFAHPKLPRLAGRQSNSF